MPRRTSSLLAHILVLTAVLVPGTAVFARPAHAQAPPACLQVDTGALLAAAEASSVIAIGTVRELSGGALAELVPEVFLKGAAASEPIRPRYRELPGCANARLSAGQRVLVFFEEEGGVLVWPTAGRVFWLDDGRATRGGDGSGTPVSENTLVHDVRVVTGQYAVPAADDDGAGIDWWKTIVPVGVASLALFGVGLYLMRIWHRIDPS